MKHALPMALALVGVGVLATLSGPNATGPKAVYAATAVRPGGFNPDPSMRPWRWADGPNPNGWFCRPPNCMGYATDGTQFVDNEIALMAATGAKYLRVEFPWFSIEPGNGTYDWSRTDYIINAAVAKGLITQPVLVYTPKWSSSYAANPPGAVSDWTTFVTAIVNRYKANVHYWEMWNEPDLNQYWNSSTANYVSQILAPGYGAVHAADPSAKVIVGPSNPSWYGNLLPAGAKGYFDIAAYHAYNGGALGGSSTVKSFLNGAGINVPIWVGEYGLEENTIHDTGQTGLLTGALTGAAPVDVAIWYSIRDDNSATCCPPVGVHPQYYGLVQYDGVTKKDGYAKMQQLLTGTVPPPTPTPSPTASPSPSPSASPTPSPSGSPRPSPTASPSPSPSGSPRPSPSTSPSSSPGPGPSYPPPSASPGSTPGPSSSPSASASGGPHASPGASASPTVSGRPGASHSPSASASGSPQAIVPQTGNSGPPPQSGNGPPGQLAGALTQSGPTPLLLTLVILLGLAIAGVAGGTVAARLGFLRWPF
jgi:hypothetical protein